MKKHDEGYVLVLVLVVMIVMCLVSASVTAFSLRNLQNQQAAIDRMQDKYAAQGEIEKAVDSMMQGKIIQTDGCEVVGNQLLRVTLSKTHDTATVTCELSISGTGEITTTTEDNVTYYLIPGELSVNYESYEVTYSSGGGDSE